MQSYRVLKDYIYNNDRVDAGVVVYESRDVFDLAKFETQVTGRDHACMTRGEGHREFTIPVSYIEAISLEEVNGTHFEPTLPIPTPISDETMALVNEPSFTFLGSDNAAGQLMALYAKACEMRGDAPEYIAHAKQLAQYMDTFCRSIGKIPMRFNMKAPVVTRRGLSPEQAAELTGLCERTAESIGNREPHSALTTLQQAINTIRRLSATSDPKIST